VPVENSSEGVVSQTLDLLLHTPLSITAEVSLRIEHHLWSASGGDALVKRICAHPQALAQCQRWLALHYPTQERVPVSSNGEAARIAAADPESGAIAGDLAGQHYALTALARHIQDDAQNTTRFAILGGSDAAPSGQDHTSLILSVPNQPGAVYDMLGPLKRHGVSMTRFESRPARTGVWTYYFYIDVEGHRSDPAVAAALAELAATAGFFKNLGSYPVA
jgi:chorismate mutase/prephenate dehydratase